MCAVLSAPRIEALHPGRARFTVRAGEQADACIPWNGERLVPNAYGNRRTTLGSDTRRVVAQHAVCGTGGPHVVRIVRGAAPTGTHAPAHARTRAVRIRDRLGDGAVFERRVTTPRASVVLLVVAARASFVAVVPTGAFFGSIVSWSVLRSVDRLSVGDVGRLRLSLAAGFHRGVTSSQRSRQRDHDELRCLHHAHDCSPTMRVVQRRQTF